MRDTVLKLWPEIEWIQSAELREQVTRTWQRALELSPLTPDDLNRIPFTLLVPNCPTTFMEHKRCVVHIARKAAESMIEFMGSALPIDHGHGDRRRDPGRRGQAAGIRESGRQDAAEQARRDAAPSVYRRCAGDGVRRARRGLPHHRSACRRGRSGEAHHRGLHRASRRLHGVSAVQEPGGSRRRRQISMATIAAPIKNCRQATITATMSEWAASLQFEHLSADAVYQAKRFLLDSIGCALGGYQQHDVAIALEVLDEIAGPGKATLIGSGKRMDRGFGVAGQRADDPLHGLQRHLLEAGSVASVRHFPRSYCRLRARRKRWSRADRRPGARSRIRDAALRGGISRYSRARLASCNADGFRFADRRRANAAPHAAADSARHRHQRQRARHAGRGYCRQADDDEEHRRSHGHAERHAGGAAGGEGLHRPGARHRRQRRAGALLWAGVEAEHPDRRAGRFLAYHTMWDEGVSHRGADAHARSRRCWRW